MLPAWHEDWQIETSSNGFGSKKRKIIILKKEIKLINTDKVPFNVKQINPLLLMAAPGRAEQEVLEENLVLGTLLFVDAEQGMALWFPL